MHKAARYPGWSHFLLFLGAFLLAACGRGADLAKVASPEAPAPVDAAESAPSEMEGSLAALAEEPSEEAKEEAPAPAPPPPTPTRAPSGAPGGAPKAQLGGAEAQEPAPSAALAREPGSEKRSPQLIYTATVTMAVFRTGQALDAVEALAKSRHGYLVRRSDESITVRVPQTVFEETLNGVGRLGDVLHRDVNARDVSEEYADLEIRLRNAEVVRQRLEVLLAKATTIENALSVERELARVTQTIELLKGKLKLLNELVMFSTITVNFEERAVEHVNSDVPLPFGWLEQLGLQNLLSL